MPLGPSSKAIAAVCAGNSVYSLSTGNDTRGTCTFLSKAPLCDKLTQDPTAQAPLYVPFVVHCLLCCAALALEIVSRTRTQKGEHTPFPAPAEHRKQPAITAHLTSVPPSTHSLTLSAMASSSFWSLVSPFFSRALRSSTTLFSRSRSFARNSLQQAPLPSDPKSSEIVAPPRPLACLSPQPPLCKPCGNSPTGPLQADSPPRACTLLPCCEAAVISSM